jgi:ATP-dependent RNA circularization protein (DNA/RNA ligase family)
VLIQTILITLAIITLQTEKAKEEVKEQLRLEMVDEEKIDQYATLLNKLHLLFIITTIHLQSGERVQSNMATMKSLKSKQLKHPLGK